MIRCMVHIATVACLALRKGHSHFGLQIILKKTLFILNKFTGLLKYESEILHENTAAE